MPIRLSDLKTKSTTFTFDFLGEAVTITYRNGVITPEWESRRELTDPSRQAQATVLALSEIVASWDVLGDDGQPVPVTVETLTPMPLQFLNRVLEEVMADMRPKARSGGSFGAG